MNFKKADWEAWLENPVTRDFFTAIAERRDEAKADWDESSWLGEDFWQDGRKVYAYRAACRGRYEMAQDILNINFEEQDNAEQERDTSD